MRFSLPPAFASVLLLLGGCATTAVDMEEPRRLLGTESGVRVDAQIETGEIRPGTQFVVTYDVTNERAEPIAIAELVPETSYDRETRTFTTTIGSEVPGNMTLPRLTRIEPGEKRTFSARARFVFVAPAAAGNSPTATFRMKLHFLGETAPFAALIGIPEVMVTDPGLADALFPLWLEHNEVIYTNGVPMRLGGRRPDRAAPEDVPGQRRGRG